MGNNKIVKTAAAVALGASVLATSVAPGAASAATTYKVKSGKLVNAKTGKAVKGYKTFKKVLYKDGKKFTGLRSAKYYKAGKLATGTYKGKYYKTGVKFNGLKSGVYYKAGVKGTGVYKSVYYKAGKVATGVSGKKQYVKGALANKIVYKGNYYVKGVKATGVSAKKQYVKGPLANKIVYNGNYYVNGVKGTGTLKGVYYVKGPKAQGLVGGTFYVNGKAGDGVAAGVKYVGGKLAQGLVGGTFYVDGKLAQGSVDGVFYIDGQKDETAPVITVDKEAQTVEFGTETVTLPVATVTDNSGETVTATQVITYNGEVVEKVDTKKAGKYTITFTAKDSSNNSITKEATITVAAEKIAVESASAINATDATFTVTLAKEVSAEDLKGTKITLKGDKELTAEFVSIDKKVATFKVSNTLGSAYNGNYTLTSSALTFADSLKTTYEAIITGTSVEGFVVDASSKPVANVTVTADGKTTKTDANGYYKLNVTAGAVEVVADNGTGYFKTKKTANVTRNFSTVLNTTVQKIDTTKLAIDGLAINKKTGDKLVGVDVELQVKGTDGKWSTVATTETVTGGVYEFGNSQATDSTTNTATIEKSLADAIDFGKEIQVVYTKDISKGNLTGAFEKTTVPVKLNEENERTAVATELRPISEIKEFKLGATWQDLAGEDNDADASAANPTLNVTLVAPDGKTALTDSVAISTTKVANAKSTKDAVELVAENFFGASAAKPTLVSGTYYLLVKEDSNTKNAISVVPVQVTEGTNGSVTAEIEKARSLQTTGKYKAFTYNDAFNAQTGNELTVLNSSTTAAPTPSSLKVLATVNVYKKVGNVNVLVKSYEDDGTTDNRLTFAVDQTAKSAIAAQNVDQLGQGSYTVEYATPFIQGGKAAITETIGTKDVTSADLAFETASTLTVALTNKAGTAIAASTPTTDVYANVEVIDENGKTVVADKAYKVTTSGSDSVVSIEGLTPGNYKLKVTTAGYEGNTSDSVKVYDIQAQTASVKLEAKAATKITGYVKFEDDYTDVTAGTVMVYDEKGAVVAYEDVKTGHVNYEFDQLTAGKKYTFVVRGTGFETQAQTVTLKEGENDALNFKVVKGGQGKAKFSISDSSGRVLDNAASTGATVVAKDKVKVESEKTIATMVEEKDANGTVASAPDFDGTFGVTRDATDTKLWASEEALSAGDYTLAISASTTNKTLATEKVFTIQNIGQTISQSIVLPTTNSSLSIKVTGTVTGTTLKQDEVDAVVAFDKDGNIVDKVILDAVTGTASTFSLEVGRNAEYTIAFYGNGHFMTSKVVTAQDFDISNVKLDADEATR